MKIIDDNWVYKQSTTGVNRDEELDKTQYIPCIAPYIDRNKLIKSLDSIYFANPIAEITCGHIITHIKCFRGADADVVEVVRCKDCKYKTQPDYCLYGHTHCAKRCNIPTMDDDFCSYGERKGTE